MYSSTDFEVWYQTNHHFSIAAFDLLHNLLQNSIARSKNDPDARYSNTERDRSKLLKIASEMSFTPAFEQICQRFNTSGGNIRTIALNSAFMTADAEEPVQMKHILTTTKTEYEKLGKSLTSVEVAGWI